MLRLKIFNMLILIILEVIGVAFIFTRFTFLPVIFIFLIILFELISYKIKYIIICYKLKYKNEINNFKLSKFDSIISNILLKDLKREWKLDEKIHKE